VAKQAHKDYSATPLTTKLGIKPGARVQVINAPAGFDQTLGPLPDGAEMSEAGPFDVIVLFVEQEIELLDRFPTLKAQMTTAGGFWIGWPKKAAKRQTDLTFENVQRVGLDAGLVDNKTCAIDEVWQALRFVVRVKDRVTRR
jgi:hypothetical protein